MTTVFLVDDHPAVRAGTRSFLGDFDIVGEADNATDAVTGILATRPDVALIDVHLDEPQGGAHVVAAVKEAAPQEDGSTVSDTEFGWGQQEEANDKDDIKPA